MGGELFTPVKFTPLLVTRLSVISYYLLLTTYYLLLTALGDETKRRLVLLTTYYLLLTTDY